MLVFYIRPFREHLLDTCYSILITGSGRMKTVALSRPFQTSESSIKGTCNVGHRPLQTGGFGAVSPEKKWLNLPGGAEKSSEKH